MPQIYCGSPANTATYTSASLVCHRAKTYTMAIWSHLDQAASVVLQGAFEPSFSPVWPITTVTACAGGTTGSGRYIADTDHFPFKRATIAPSASPTAGSGIEVWLDNREF